MEIKLNIENEKILLKIIKKFNLEKGQYINIELFEKMYKYYENEYTKLEFAQFLGIKRSNYYSMRNKGTKAKILMNVNLSKENKKIILDEVIEKYNLSKYQLISYKNDDRTKVSFLELREKYKVYFTNEEFAELIGIRSNENLKNMRIKNNLGRILTNVELTNEEKEKIFLEVKTHPLYKEGKRINYEEFKNLFEKYKRYFSELEFAEILGITTYAYNSMKYCNKRCIIKDYKIMKKIKDINLENRLYTKSEIENICSKKKITIDQFIIYVIQKSRVQSAIEYKKALNMNNGIWIGDSNMSKSFITKNYDEMQKEIEVITQCIVKKYNMYYYKEDLISMAISYSFEKCGDLEKNFGYNIEILKKLLCRRLNRYIKGECVIEKLKSTKALNENYVKTKKYNRKIQNKFINQLDKYENKEERDLKEKIFNEVYSYYKNGYESSQIIKIIEKKFEISQSDLLNLLEEHIEEKDEENYL